MRCDAPALIFGPGLPPGGAQGTVAISALGVEVVVGERSQRVNVNAVTLREVGFGKPGLEIAWRETDAVWAAHVLDSEAAKRLLGASPLASTAQAAVLLRGRRRHKAGRTLGWTLLASFVLLPGISLALLILNANRVAGWAAEKIPIEQEVALGRQTFASMRGGVRLQEGESQRAVQIIGARLTQGSRYHYEFHVVDDATLNAFALPGGIVVVHSGLIAATKRPEELAGVLAHEVQHVELRHSLRGMIKELGLRGLWSVAMGDWGGSMAGQAALELTSLKFSRDDESEADQKGFDALLNARVDPSGMPAFFKTMSAQAADAPAAFLSTHPLSAERERALAVRVASLPSRNFDALDLGAWPPRE